MVKQQIRLAEGKVRNKKTDLKKLSRVYSIDK